MGKQWKQCQTIFEGSRITADGDCSHEIKRRLLLGRKVMTNLDSIFKSRDITLLTKFCLVKAMVFPVVMYGCEIWTVKKAQHWRIDAFELWCWRRLLRVPWTARKSNQSILKEISPGVSLEGMMLKLKLQYFGHVKSWLMWRVDSLEKTDAGRNWGQEEKGTTEDEMAGWHHGLDERWVWVNCGSWWWTRRRYMRSKSQTRLSNWMKWVNERICLQCRRPRFNPWVRKIPWRRKWQPTPVFLPRLFHGQTMGSQRVRHNWATNTSTFHPF